MGIKLSPWAFTGYSLILCNILEKEQIHILTPFSIWLPYILLVVLAHVWSIPRRWRIPQTKHAALTLALQTLAVTQNSPSITIKQVTRDVIFILVKTIYWQCSSNFKIQLIFVYGTFFMLNNYSGMQFTIGLKFNIELLRKSIRKTQLLIYTFPT